MAIPAQSQAAEHGKSVPPKVEESLGAGIPQDLIILYDDSAVEAEAAELRSRHGLDHDDQGIISRKAEQYRELKLKVSAEDTGHEIEELQDYDQLPMRFIRLRSTGALRKLLSDNRIKGIFENRPIYHQLTQSLPLIRQPAMSSLGYRGTGSTVAVLDTGINFALPDFGSCSSPGIPANCRVPVSIDSTLNRPPYYKSVSTTNDTNGHGTNVSGIVAAVAPEGRIASIKVFDQSGLSYDSYILSGINWAIANRNSYNIVALNMSLGDGTNNTAACSDTYLAAVNNARAAGIMPVAASGNERYTNGLSRPACTPGVISVGAVYDSNSGGWTWGTTPDTCTDSTTSADKVACFSNSASFLTILAPGAMITAAGSTKGGTSQASPHVAGAVAVLRSAFPSETLEQIASRLTTYGKTVTDPRNGIAKPRLDLLASLGTPANDLLASRSPVSGDAVQTQGTNASATMEPGEPLHAGQTGGRSVWWGWTPGRSGVVTIDTHGSDFDTLLAVYTGIDMASLSQVAANNNDGISGGASSVSFNALAGAEYLIAVDGVNGASGLVKLAVSNAMSADLSLSSSATPNQISTGQSSTFSATVTNLGPSEATNTKVSIIIPSSVAIVSTPLACSIALPLVTCTAGTLVAPAGTTFDLVLSSTSPGQMTLQGSTSSDAADPSTSNNSATGTVTVNEPLPVPALSPWLFMVAALLPAAFGSLRAKPGNPLRETEL